MSTRARLPLLLACLAAAIVALLSMRTSVFSGASAGSEGARYPCRGAEPPLARGSVDEIKQLRASVLAVVGPLAESRYQWGAVPPEVVWSDGSPSRFSASGLVDGKFLASFEMRVWAKAPALRLANVDTVADVFLFTNPGDARRFFEAASNTHCHRDGVPRAVAQPPGGRDLIWDNPDGVTQQDVFLLSGSRVYRVSDVPRGGGGYSTATKPGGIATVNRLACALPEARCSSVGSSRSP
ncbi:MAG TPA: hypothetical protein VNR42_09520 [Solirubrobacteraceae bacterium]|nr:hypothetical protein [Solirubrobacteraceae bacterium]